MKIPPPKKNKDMKSMGGQKLTSTVVTIEQNVENQTNQNYFYKTEQILDYGILEPRLKDKKKTGNYSATF